ncbi:hypothetical protein [Chondrinema litorale]|uniref:hypothetical protein n=1 Tax=Chondrinema litorale TaxID=2994555 RepID=UPI002543044D|nr:hypothetical protein [Chondrinema litorale]UZR95954.1 hypothetical protein OQ292_09025 [Chondrinema litorale]
MSEINYIQPDNEGNIEIPEHLVILFNKLLTQLRFHTISGKNEMLAILHSCQIAEAYFRQFVNEGVTKKRLYESLKEAIGIIQPNVGKSEGWVFENITASSCQVGKFKSLDGRTALVSIHIQADEDELEEKAINLDKLPEIKIYT